MQIENKQVLVTGGFGFIGSHLVRKLVRAGAFVTVLKKPGSVPTRAGWMRRSPQIKIIACVEHFSKADLVFHVAAAGVRRQGTYEELAQTNVVLTRRLLERARQVGTETFVLTNSGFEYARQRETCSGINENCPVEARDSYAKTKLEALDVALRFKHEFKLVIPRIFSTFGPHEDPTRLIPYVICQCLADRDVILRSTGNQVRDYLYVEDTVDALTHLACKADSSGEIFNVGSAKPLSVKALVHKIGKMVRDTETRFYFEGKPLPKGEPEYFVSDNEKLKNSGWMQRFSLEAGLQKTIDQITCSEALWKKN